MIVPDGRKMIASPAMYDFNKDGLPDFVIGSEDGKIIVIGSNTRRKEFEILADVKASNTPITSAPVIADVFGSGKLNIVFMNSMNKIQVVDTNAKIIKNFRVWPMFLGGAAHINRNGLGEYKSLYTKKLAFGIFLLLAFIAFKAKTTSSRNSKRVKVTFL